MMRLGKNLSDPVGKNFRTILATIAGTLAPAPGTFTPQEVKAALGNLTAALGASVNQVALGKEPEYRECPKCSHLTLCGTTLCSDCWINVMDLDPLAPGDCQG